MMAGVGLAAPSREPPLDAPTRLDLCRTRYDSRDSDSRTLAAASGGKTSIPGTCRCSGARSAAIGQQRGAHRGRSVVPARTWVMLPLRVIKLFAAQRACCARILLQARASAPRWRSHTARALRCCEPQHVPHLHKFEALLQPEHWPLVAPAKCSVVYD